MNNLGYEIDLLPVGDASKSGDAILMRFGDLFKGGTSQKVVLIDGGYKCTAEAIKSHLHNYYNCRNKAGKLQIDLMILSHPDIDHVGGLVELANDSDIQIELIMMHRPWEELKVSWFKDGRITHNSLKQRLKDAFSKAYELDCATQNTSRTQIQPGSYNFNGAKFHILAPSSLLYQSKIAQCEKTPDAIVQDMSVCGKMFSKIVNEEPYKNGDYIHWYYDEQTSAINETSLVILFEYEESRILFTGDAGIDNLTEAISYAKKHNIDLSKLDVIKMPHHGSRKNVTPEIMDELGCSGTACYFSCAPNDVGHHPSKRLVNMLNQKGFNIYTTQGSILWRHHNSPSRSGYSTASKLGNFLTMETK